MPLSSTQRRLGIVAGYLGALQGLVWFILSVVCLVIYYQGANIDPSSGSFNSVVYLRFLNQDAVLPLDALVTPKDFAKFMWVYVVFDICWIIFSLNQVHGIKKDSAKLSNSFKFFAAVSIMVSGVDIILVILIGMDYDDTCTGNVTDMGKAICQNGMIPVLVIVAKGFALLIVNIVIGYQMAQLGKMLAREEGDDSDVRYGYRSGPRLRYNVQSGRYEFQYTYGTW